MAILTPTETIGEDAVPAEVRVAPRSPASNLREARDSAERGKILHALDETGWNVSGAAARR